MEAITLPIYNTEGKEIDSLKLDKDVFDGTINTAAIYQTIIAHRANQRRALAQTKTRGEVSGGGRKPWKQKGTGRARVGSIRSPLWRHGGVIFGPHPRDLHYNLPEKIRNLALKSSLNAKVKESNLIVIDKVNVGQAKTKEVSRVFSNFKIKAPKRQKHFNLLLLLDKIDNNLKLASRNISFLDLNLAKDTNTYEVLSHHKLIITKEGLKDLTNRLKK